MRSSKTTTTAAAATTYKNEEDDNNSNKFITGHPLRKHSKTSFEKNCFPAWASTLNMGLIDKVDMVCLSPVGYGV